MTGQIGGTNKVAIAERQRQAVEYRKAGLGYQAIADRLGYTHASAARKAVMAALKLAVREPARELIDLELARLDDLLAAIWGDARKGNVLKIDRVLKIMARRADLLGLDAPARFADVTDPRRDAEAIAAEIGKGGDPAVVDQIERDILIMQGVRR